MWPPPSSIAAELPSAAGGGFRLIADIPGNSIHIQLAPEPVVRTRAFAGLCTKARRSFGFASDSIGNLWCDHSLYSKLTSSPAPIGLGFTRFWLRRLVRTNGSSKMQLASEFHYKMSYIVAFVRFPGTSKEYPVSCFRTDIKPEDAVIVGLLGKVCINRPDMCLAQT